ncbi:hypothetical protein [Plantactinospora sp. GCM10030261]|uniref:hypothetical protein n=1 Tax=Plantactinospora sp. GCM10030261 TaxID=3273420 RepID=UPI0036119117
MPAPDSPTGAVPNNWNVYDTFEMLFWDADFPWRLGTEPLLAWQEVLLEAGERHGVLRVEQVDTAGYDRTRDGFIGGFVRRHPDRIPAAGDWLPQGFVPDKWPHVRTASRLCYGTDTGIEEGWFADMAELAARVGLRDYPGRPPVTLVTDAGAGPEDDPSVVVTVGLSTDIWLPWNPPGHRLGSTPLDNRRLAACNAPRLNAFLAEIRHSAIELGGTWAWSDNFVTPPWTADERGIVL